MLHNKFKYVLFLILSGLLAILYNEYIMFIFFLLIIVLPIVSLGIMFYAYKNIQANLLPVTNVANKGDEIKVPIHLVNQTMLPITNIKIYLKFRNTFTNKYQKKEFIVSIDSKSEQVVSFHLMSEFCGNIEFTLTGIRIYDYFKIFSRHKRQCSAIHVAILPSFYEILEVFPSNLSYAVESDYYSTVKSGDDPSEVFAIREYREGDRPQRIHWKLSAKQNQLMIKEFSEPLNCSILIYLNLLIKREQNLLVNVDALLESALSLSYSFINKGQMHYLAWYDKEVEEYKKVRIFQEKDIFDAVDGLLRAKPYQDNSDSISRYLSENPKDFYTDLFYVTGDISSKQLDSLHMVNALSKEIIYVNDENPVNDVYEKECEKEPRIINEIRDKVFGFGIGLSLVNAGNMKSDIEQLKFD